MCEGSVSVPRQPWGAVPSLPRLWDHVPISHLHRSQINPLLLCGLPCNGCRRKRNVIYLEILFPYSGSEWTYLEHQSPARSTSPPAHNKINPTCSQRESPRIMWSMAASVSSLQAKNVAYCRGLAMVFHKKTTSGNAGSLFLWGSCALLASSGSPSWRWEVLDLQTMWVTMV